MKYVKHVSVPLAVIVASIIASATTAEAESLRMKGQAAALQGPPSVRQVYDLNRSSNVQAASIGLQF